MIEQMNAIAETIPPRLRFKHAMNNYTPSLKQVTTRLSPFTNNWQSLE
ncbi:MAG UNVERIFIED_CONTAM: hypothetical protein LVT10_22505 [Anaerolineae bacterium]|jgi:hypothetical protein